VSQLELAVKIALRSELSITIATPSLQRDTESRAWVTAAWYELFVVDTASTLYLALQIQRRCLNGLLTATKLGETLHILRCPYLIRKSKGCASQVHSSCLHLEDKDSGCLHVLILRVSSRCSCKRIIWCSFLPAQADKDIVPFHNTLIVHVDLRCMQKRIIWYSFSL
jgi:hypothetical protein